MNQQELRERLIDLAEPKYQKFAASLLPDAEKMFGVRLPALRKLAKEMAQDDWRAFWENASFDYFEERLLAGMVIGCADMALEERLSRIAGFIPLIRNWSICDSFCAGLKFTKKHPDEVWNFLQPYLQSTAEYEVRFGVVMLLDFYITEPYLNRVFELLDAVKHDGYYVKMAVAWAVSLCYIRFPDQTMKYLRQNTLDSFTYNKALQKMIESYRVDDQSKAVLRRMKRK